MLSCFHFFPELISLSSLLACCFIYVFYFLHCNVTMMKRDKTKQTMFFFVTMELERKTFTIVTFIINCFFFSNSLDVVNASV